MSIFKEIMNNLYFSKKTSPVTNLFNLQALNLAFDIFGEKNLLSRKYIDFDCPNVRR